MWQHRWLCTFANTAWADRHCDAPDEEDSRNVFNHSDGNDNSNGNNPDNNGNDGSNNDEDNGDIDDDDKNGRNSTGSKDDSDSPNQSGEASPAPTPGPANYNNQALPVCRTNRLGQFFVSEQAERDFYNGSAIRSTVVSFAYQVQGSLDLNVSILRSTVLPVLERELSAALVPALFAPQACRLTEEQQEQLQQQQQQQRPRPNPTAEGRVAPTVTTFAFTPLDEQDQEQYSNSQDNDNRKRSLATALADGPEDAPVTGLQPIPDDVLLPNYEGVRCRTQLVNDADRCFILTGAYSLSGPENVDWALPAAQKATEKAMNEQHSLDDAHPLVRHVLYLDALDSSEQPWLVGKDRPPVLIDHNDDADRGVSGDRISTAWVWVVVGATLTILMTGLIVWWRRYRTRSGYDNRRGCRQRRPPQERITRGYLAYPSPDRSPDNKRPSYWMIDNPAISNDLSPDMVSSPPMSWSELEEEPVTSFDPVLGPPYSSSIRNAIQRKSAEETAETAVWHDGSFPSFSDNSLPPTESVVQDDVEFGAVSFFCDDEDDDSCKWGGRHPASPEAGWLRDLV